MCDQLAGPSEKFNDHGTDEVLRRHTRETCAIVQPTDGETYPVVQESLPTVAHEGARILSALHSPETDSPRQNQGESDSGRYWSRTSDFRRVKAAL